MNLPEITIARPPAGLRFDMPVVPENRAFALAPATATITIFDVIGFEVTAARIADALRQIGGRPVTVQLNSPGGSYWEGVAIYNLLRAHPMPVTVQVLGMAASAASIIAMAGKTIEIARNAEIMIHRVSTIALGTSEDMAAAAEYLGNLDAALAQTYSVRSGMAADRVSALMSAETFMPSGQALALGFADKLLDRDADPKPKTARATAPQSKGDLEAALRQVGFSKAIAARAAAGGFAAVTGNDVDGVEVDRVAARIDAFTQKIAAWR